MHTQQNFHKNYKSGPGPERTFLSIWGQVSKEEEIMVLSVEELEKSFSKKEQELPGSLFLLYGEETFLLENIVKKIKKNFGELMNGINFITIDETNLKELISDLESPAFGFEKKLIIVKNTSVLGKEGKKKNAELTEQKEKILDYLKDNWNSISDSVVLVFVEEDIEKKSFYKWIESNGGIVCEFEVQKVPSLGKRIKAICNSYRINITDDTIRYLIETCGTSLQDLVNETRKLVEYAGENGTITKETIDLLSTKQIQAVIFDLTDNLGKKDAKSALEVFDGLLYAKEPIQKILITLYHHFKKLYVTKLSDKFHTNLAESLNLKPNQMFLTNKYKVQANYFTERELKQMVEELIELDANYKVGLIDLQVGLESILCRYCSK